MVLVVVSVFWISGVIGLIGVLMERLMMLFGWVLVSVFVLVKVF